MVTHFLENAYHHVHLPGYRTVKASVVLPSLIYQNLDSLSKVETLSLVYYSCYAGRERGHLNQINTLKMTLTYLNVRIEGSRPQDRNFLWLRRAKDFSSIARDTARMPAR